MPVIGVVGEFFGDEGKGKIVDRIASGEIDHIEKPAVVARYCGGPNAGHTLVVPEGVIDLHQIPSGIATEGTMNIIGNGTSVDPIKLVAEIEKIENTGIDVTPENLMISSAANLILPYHISGDEIREATDETRQGSTKCGIADSAADKAYRTGFRVSSLLRDMNAVEEAIHANWVGQFHERRRYGLPETNYRESYESFARAAETLGKFVTDTVLYAHDVLNRPRNNTILAEGAQSFWLDVDHGSYPNTTSGSSSALGISPGLGVPAKYIERIIGVSKATPSRVGDGPLPTEIHDEHLLKELRGNAGDTDGEYGTTTGRERRMGYLDIPMMRRALTVNGTDEVALTKLDRVPVYGKEIPVCVGYLRKQAGSDRMEQLHVAPASAAELEECEPVYIVLKSWEEDISGVRNFDKLPDAAKNYVKRIEQLAGTTIRFLGVGPGRDQIIVRD